MRTKSVFRFLIRPFEIRLKQRHLQSGRDDVTYSLARLLLVGVCMQFWLQACSASLDANRFVSVSISVIIIIIIIIINRVYVCSLLFHNWLLCVARGSPTHFPERCLKALSIHSWLTLLYCLLGADAHSSDIVIRHHGRQVGGRSTVHR